MSKERSNFSSKLGFILAAAGSAVGLGNLWRFPYLAAKHGGGIFLLVYILLAVTFGFALLISEFTIGRKTRLSCIGAFKKLDKRFSFVGYLAAAAPIIILPYYSVIGGWVTKYLFAFITGDASKSAENGYFDNFIGSTFSPILWFFIFLILAAVIVLFGIEKGTERVCKLVMPVLVILTLIIAIYSMCLPGAMDGVIYYIKPDFSKFSINTVLAAMGQLFYSMSLSMGITVTYGSYLKKNINIETSVRSVELFDTGIAFFAGLMIIPAVFSFSGGDEEALGKGPGLMFETLPKVFDSMKGGTIIGIAFFVLVLFAALTSAIALMETVVSILCDRFRLKRKKACFITLLICIALGLPSSLGYGLLDSVKILGFQILDFFDFISNSVIMPLTALFTCIVIGYIIKPQAIIDEVECSSKFKSKKLYVFVIKYLAPICIVLIILTALLEAFGIITI